MNTANRFIAEVNPYRKKHLAEDIDMFGLPIWETKRSYLTNQIIENTIRGEIETGYFSTHWVTAIVLDVDNHTGNQDRIRNIYKQIRKHLPEPSYSFGSPRGLHLYWILNKKYPIKLIYQAVIHYLPTSIQRHVEFKPTTKTGLRIPHESRLLSNTNTKYHYGQIFCGLDLYEAIKEGRARAKRTTIKHIFIKGYSNQVFIKVIAYLFYQGHTEQEAEGIIREQLFRDGYTGELHNTRRLRCRIASSYRNIKKLFNPLPKQQKLEHLQTAQKFLPLVENRRPQLQKTFLKFMSQLISWIEYIDLIRSEPAELDYWSAIYPTFRAKTDQGYYPLPASLIERMISNNHNRRTEFLNILKSGQHIYNISNRDAAQLTEPVITDTLHSYSTTLHICKYYRIDKNILFNPSFSSSKGGKEGERGKGSYLNQS